MYSKNKYKLSRKTQLKNCTAKNIIYGREMFTKFLY